MDEADDALVETAAPLARDVVIQVMVCQRAEVPP